MDTITRLSDDAASGGTFIERATERAVNVTLVHTCQMSSHDIPMLTWMGNMLVLRCSSENYQGSKTVHGDCMIDMHMYWNSPRQIKKETNLLG